MKYLEIIIRVQNHQSVVQTCFDNTCSEPAKLALRTHSSANEMRAVCRGLGNDRGCCTAAIAFVFEILLLYTPLASSPPLSASAESIFGD